MNRSLQLVLVLCVASLIPGRARTDATTTVLCKDGTTAMGGRGACHGHGGVDKTGGSAPKAAEPSPSAKQEANTGGPVTCKDGSSWPKSGRGACRGHGGVLKPGATATAPAAPRAAAPPPATPRAAAPAPPATHPSAPVVHSNPTAGTAVAQTKSKHASSDPTGALARCKDGIYWHGTKHSGSCSRHGGVAEWLQGPS
jgi:Protein of unknown function (DUF3761)